MREVLRFRGRNGHSWANGRALRLGVAAMGLGGLVLAGLPGTSGAITIVTLYVDNVHGTHTTGCTATGAGACKTIQQGVTAAEGHPTSTIILDVAGSSTAYPESVTVDLADNQSLTIEGTGATKPTINSGAAGSDFHITPANQGPVTIDGLIISGGKADFGGGIQLAGTGDLTVGEDTFSSNTAKDNGGAIDAYDGCGTGGSGELRVINSTFDHNTLLTGPDGGAIDFADCTSGNTLIVSDSTFVDNSAPDDGGALATWTGGTITNSTFVGNTSDGTGALSASTETTTIEDDTFSANPGPALHIFASPVIVSNSILDNAPGGKDCSAAPTDAGHNVASDNSCGFGPTSVSTSSTIGLQALAANGSTGPQTQAITSTSSAHNVVPLSSCTLDSDERGDPRPGVGPNCDAGAFEVQPPPGYDLAGSDGGVFVFPTGQSKGFYGSLPGLGVHVNDVVGIVPTNHFAGYDLVGSDGGVFVFPTGQSSGFYGSLPGLTVHVNDVVGIVPTDNDTGYDLVGSDGGVFVFPTGQSSGFFGSLPGITVHLDDIVGIVASPDGGGYFLVGRDGGVFTFGDAPFLGSLPKNGITRDDVTGIAATPDGQGYYVVAADGTVYPFGDAVSHGSLATLHQSATDIVSIVPTPDGGGYWLVGKDGAVFPFGDAPSQGSLPALTVHVSNIIGAVPTAAAEAGPA